MAVCRSRPDLRLPMRCKWAPRENSLLLWSRCEQRRGTRLALIATTGSECLSGGRECRGVREEGGGHRDCIEELFRLRLRRHIRSYRGGECHDYDVKRSLYSLIWAIERGFVCVLNWLISPLENLCHFHTIGVNRWAAGEGCNWPISTCVFVRFKLI